MPDEGLTQKKKKKKQKLESQEIDGAKLKQVATDEEQKRPKKQKKLETETKVDKAEPQQTAVDGEPKQSKKKKEKQGPEPPQEAVEKAAGRKDLSVSKKKQKKLKGKSEVQDESNADQESHEDRLKLAQRKIQDLVRRLKAEGKSKTQIEAAKKDLKKELGSLRKEDGSRQRKTQEFWDKKKQAQEKGTKTSPNENEEAKVRKHDLVVIPVVWRGRHDVDDLLKAAQEVKSCVAQQGVDVWIDSRRHYTPGQKFAHWEFRGVMLRVEIGPADYEKGMCQVCLAKEPGDYKSVEKIKVRLPPRGARQLLLALKERGLSQIAIERRPGDNDDGSDDEDAATELKPISISSGDDLGGNWAPRNEEGQKKGKKRKRDSR